MSGILDWFRTRFERPSQRYIAEFIDGDRVKLRNQTKPDNTVLEAGKHYFQLWLSELFLANDREWFKSWHAAVHSAVSFDFGGNTVLASNIIGASRLKELDSDHLDRVIQQNLKLTELMPFNGGTVGITTGLLAMQGQDDVAKFIKVLGDFGSLLAVPQLSAVTAIAAPLANGISSLVGATNGELMLGIDRVFESQGGGGNSVLKAGYLAVVLDTAANLDTRKLFVVDDHLQYGDTLDASVPLAKRNYMLLRLAARDARDDWESLASIQDPYRKAIEMLKVNQSDQAQAYLRTAIATALTAPELTALVDRRRVIEQLKSRYEEARTQLGVGGAFAAFDDSLASLMENASPVGDARLKPEIKADEAFALSPWR